MKIEREGLVSTVVCVLDFRGTGFFHKLSGY